MECRRKDGSRLAGAAQGTLVRNATWQPQSILRRNADIAPRQAIECRLDKPYGLTATRSSQEERPGIRSMVGSGPGRILRIIGAALEDAQARAFPQDHRPRSRAGPRHVKARPGAAVWAVQIRKAAASNTITRIKSGWNLPP